MNDELCLKNIIFADGMLDITLTSIHAEKIISFSYVRSFRMFAESDMYEYINRIDWEEHSASPKIFKSSSTQFQDEFCKFVPEERSDPGILTYLILTPQECVEVLSLGDP